MSTMADKDGALAKAKAGGDKLRPYKTVNDCAGAVRNREEIPIVHAVCHLLMNPDSIIVTHT